MARRSTLSPQEQRRRGDQGGPAPRRRRGLAMDGVREGSLRAKQACK